MYKSFFYSIENSLFFIIKKPFNIIAQEELNNQNIVMTTSKFQLVFLNCTV